MSSGESKTHQTDHGRQNCPSCGKSISPSAAFCEHCGSRVSVDHTVMPMGPNQPPEVIRSQDPVVIQAGDPAASPQGMAQQINVGKDPSGGASQYVHVAPPTMNVHVATQPGYPQQHARPSQQQKPKESATFAIVTLVLYIFTVTYPVALIMNIIGMFAGPRRGCFVALFLVYVVGGGILTVIAAAIIFLINANPQAFG